MNNRHAAAAAFQIMCSDLAVHTSGPASQMLYIIWFLQDQINKLSKYSILLSLVNQVNHDLQYLEDLAGTNKEMSSNSCVDS